MALPRGRALVLIAAVALAYYLAARLGLLLAFEGSNASPVWPPSGIAFAALALWGRRVLPGVALGALLANVVVFAANRAAEPGVIAAVSLGIMAGNSAEALLGVAALRRWVGAASPFERLLDVAKFVLVVLGACTVSAAVGTACLVAGGIVPAGAAGAVALTWWTGDAIGLLVVAPLLMTVLGAAAAPAPRDARGGIALAALLLLMAVLGALVFGAPAGSPGADRRLVYLFIPCIAWAAYRHGPRGVALCSLLTAGLAVWATTRGLGPFARGHLNDSLIVLQTFVGLCAVTGLVLAADRSERRRLGRDSSVRQDLAAPWLVLLGCLGVAVLGWHLLASDTERRARERFDFLAAGIEVRVAERMRQYEQVLRGAAGLFAASNEIDRDEWRRYVAQLDLARNYPGIQAVGWARLLRPQEVDAHVAAVRAEGYPEYALRPAGARDAYSAIVYIEPFDARNRRAFGYDMTTEPVRRAALELARDGGAAALSGKVTLLQETEADVQPGVLLYLPVYRLGAPVSTPEERRAALLGWVYSPYRMRDLMRGILGPELGGVALRIHDAATAGDDGLLYDSNGGPRSHAAAPAGERLIDLPGRRWRLEVQALPAFDATIDRQKAQIVLIAGVGLSLLLFALVRSLTLTRERAEMLAEDMTAALRDRERAAYRAEHQLRAVMDATPLGVFFTDAGGARLYTNRSWQRISGLSAEQALGEGWLAAVHEDDRDAVRAAWRKAVAAHAPYAIEHRVRRPDGSVAWVRAIAAPLDDEREAVGHVGIVEDITERRAMDADLAAKNEALLRSNTELAQFAYVASHDLQEPLRTVTSYSQLLLRRHRGTLDGEAQEFLGYIGDGARRAQALIVDLLSLARLDSAARPFEPVALDEVLADVRRALEAALADSGATLTHDALPRVQGDRAQLAQLLQNLVGNALKFRGAEAPRVHVSAARRPDGRWRIAVADNGIGIEPRFHERIFTLFQRLHGRDDYPGTGIGLAICKKVVERHGGQIGVESAPGRGATFHFTLAPADDT